MTNKSAKNRWIKLASFWGGAMVAGHAWASATDPVAVLTQIKGVVAVSKGQAFVQAHKVMVLTAGDSVLALEGGEATIMYSGGCYERISANTMLTLTADAQCGDGSARMEDVGPLYASALGALPVTPRPNRSSKHAGSSSKSHNASQGALGATSGKSTSTQNVAPAAEPAATTSSTVVIPPPVTQLPMNSRTTDAPVSSSMSQPTLVPAAAQPAPNGPVVSVPDVMGSEEGDTPAAEFSRGAATAERAKDNKETKPHSIPAPTAAVAGSASSTPVDAGAGRAPLSQGGAGVAQALATITQEKERPTEQERERVKAVVIPPAIKEPVTPAKETVAAPQAVTPAPVSPAVTRAANPAPKQAATTSGSKDSAVDAAARKWGLGLDAQNADDGPQMFTTNE